SQRRRGPYITQAARAEGPPSATREFRPQEFRSEKSAHIHRNPRVSTNRRTLRASASRRRARVTRLISVDRSDVRRSSHLSPPSAGLFLPTSRNFFKP